MNRIKRICFFDYHDGVYFSLIPNYRYIYNYKKDSYELIYIPKNFAFNGLTMYPFKPNCGELECAMVHDFLLREGYERKFARMAFKDLMKIKKLNKFKSFIFNLAVKLNDAISKDKEGRV